MRYIILIFIGMFCSASLIAQKRAAIWYLGNGNGVDFSKNPPEILENAPEANDHFTTISDLDGNLVLYCNDNTVWNANHRIMENGTGLVGAKSIILPRPGNENQYYIFQFKQSNNEAINSSVIYSLIDVEAFNGHGSVIEKNTILYSNLHGSFTVSGSCKSGYWLVGETNKNIIDDDSSDKIFAFRIDEYSVSTTPVISSPVSIGNSGYYRLSPDGKKLFFAYSGNSPYEGNAIADFDLITGKVSNFFNLKPCCGEGEFSADGKFLYVIVQLESGNTLRQYDLSQPTYPYTTIASNLPFLYGPQLAADGKIYFLVNDERKMAVINNPDQPGAACNFVIDELFNFPNQLQNSRFPATATDLLYKNPEMPDAGPDVEICSGEAIQLGGTNTQTKSYFWAPRDHLDNPNVSNPMFSYHNPYDSVVNFTYKLKSCDMDQVKISVFPKPRPVIYGSRSVCPKAEQIDYWADDNEGYTYKWIVDGGDIVYGQGTDSIQVNWGPTNSDAKVSLIAINEFNCVSEEIVFNVRINVELETEIPNGLYEVCLNQPDNHMYQILPTRGSVYTWEIEGGTITEGQGTNRVVVDWGKSGDNWIGVLEESVTIDTICFGVSPKLFVDIYQDSLEVHIDYVTLNPHNDSEAILVGGFKNGGDDMSFPLNVFRRKGDVIAWKSIFFQDDFSDSISFVDSDLQSQENVYEYYLSSTNGCQENISSKPHHTIKLSTKRNDLSNAQVLIWNSYTGWPEGVEHYEVYRKIDSASEFALVGSISGNDTSFVVQNEKDGFLHTFLIKAIGTNNEFYSWSNLVSIGFEHPLFIPNVFTPNGDDINETFMMDPIHLYGENELVIYNRWGNEVYRKENYHGHWTGEGLVSGVYYYKLYILSNQLEYKGWVQILR